MTLREIKNTLILALIFALRLLGLFMVLPVMVLYEGKIPGATPSMLGIAVGIYGFTQAILQLPYGILSDYFERRNVIIGGLVLFAIGSLIAAFSASMTGLIIGRAVQGAGAIGSPILALVSDVTRDEVRTRAMALIGISIGVTFVLAILLGPILDAYVGLNGIFMITAGLALLGILLLLLMGPKAASQKPLRLGMQLRAMAYDSELVRLNLTIFVLHALLTMSFLVLPWRIEQVTGLTSLQVWRFYLPVLVIALVCMAPILRYGDNAFWRKRLMKIAMIGVGLTIVAFISASSIPIFVVMTTLFFIAFNFLEASLPAQVSRKAPAASKGSALGLYSCSQFLGIFAGGLIGGIIVQKFGTHGIELSCLFLAIVGWLAIKQSNENTSIKKKMVNLDSVESTNG